VKPRSGQLSSIHVDAVLHLAQQPDSGKFLRLPGGVEVRRERDSLSFRPMPKTSAARSQSLPKPYSFAVDVQSGQSEVSLVERSCVLRFTVIDWPAQGRETSVTGAVLDRDRLRVPLVVRNWRPGDSVRLFGHQKRHRLSRLLNELGVSRWEKVSWPVLTSGGEIAWTRGLPVAADFAVGNSTRAGVVITEVPLS
jgi:tRNA(Ile)-lysidine synthase